MDDTTSTVDHFLPGIGADRNSFAPNVGLSVVYYYYPQASCTSSTCQLTGGCITSQDGGGSWSDPTDVTGPMSISWIANTSSGRMVGDYFSVAYTDDGVPHPVFGSAAAPVGMFLQSMFSTCTECPAPPTAPAEVAGCEGANCSSASVAVAEERQLGAAESASGALRV